MNATAHFNWGSETAMSAPIDAHLNEATGGLLPETKVASGQGWRPVQTLMPGDLVLTFDNGMQPLVDVCHHLVEAGSAPRSVETWPLLVAPGILGNKAALTLLPGQVILVESDLAEDLYGDPFVAIEARELDGMDGVTRIRPSERFMAMTLHFETDQAVFGAGGMMIVCSGTGNLLDDQGGAALYPVLTSEVAQLILSEGVMPAGAAA